MFEKKDRLGLVVYLHYNRDARKLNKFGDILYHSRRGRYLLIYIDKTKEEEVLEELGKLKLIKKIIRSQVDEIDQNFVGSLTREA